MSGDPGRPTTNPRTTMPQIWGKDLMSTKPAKPEPADDAREQARRALQTSMDTRQ